MIEIVNTCKDAEDVSSFKFYGVLSFDGYRGMLSKQRDGRYDCLIRGVHISFSSSENSNLYYTCLELLRIGYRIFEFDNLSEMIKWIGDGDPYHSSIMDRI